MKRQLTRPATAAFSADEKKRLLGVKGVGPTVVMRLEQMGITTLADLATRESHVICAEAAGLTGGTCWKNSPQARKAIDAAIAEARAATG
jgi:predicted RecB family nuclease